MHSKKCNWEFGLLHQGCNMKKKLQDFIPNTASTKSVYTMVKFGKRKDLLTHMVKRVGELKTSKNAYILALIEQDKEHENE